MMYDIIIIGGGAAGMTAVIYAARGGMKTLVLEKAYLGGQIVKTHEVENYPGFYNKPSGAELAAAFERHARSFDAEFKTETVKEISVGADGIKHVRTRKNEYSARAVIIATGASPKRLGIPGEAELVGAGVSYCAACDGAFFKGKDVAVIGGGNTAFADALYLSRMCSRVYVINRSDKLRAQAADVEKAENTKNIVIYKNMVSQRIEGSGRVSRLYALDTAKGQEGFFDVSGVVIAIGVTPDSAAAKAAGAETCEKGFIKTDMYLQTSIPGIFAAGDVRVTPLRQAVTAAADGAVAASSAINYVNGNL